MKLYAVSERSCGRPIKWVLENGSPLTLSYGVGVLLAVWVTLAGPARAMARPASDAASSLANHVIMPIASNPTPNQPAM
jgi:hypothetical protein